MKGAFHMKTNYRVEQVLKHGCYKIEKITDTRFGGWKYGLFCNNQWQEWSWSFDSLKQKIFA